MKVIFAGSVVLMDATNPKVDPKDVQEVSIPAGTYDCERVDNPFNPQSPTKWIQVHVPDDTRVLGKSEATLSTKGVIEE